MKLETDIRTAVFSPCRRYRYELWRKWSDAPACVFIGLNPSTADETQDDPTIRRCIAFARSWGHGALGMFNLFAFRATDPKEMLSTEDPVGPDNDRVLSSLPSAASMIVAAWGTHGAHLSRDKTVLSLLPKLHALRLTKDGHPSHPLYLPSNLTPFLIKQ